MSTGSCWSENYLTTFQNALWQGFLPHSKQQGGVIKFFEERVGQTETWEWLQVTGCCFFSNCWKSEGRSFQNKNQLCLGGKETSPLGLRSGHFIILVI